MSFNVFDVTASAMNAQRIQMDTISSNIANANSTRNAQGEREVYRKKEVTFQAVYKNALANEQFPSANISTSVGPMGAFLRGGVSMGDVSGITQGVEVAGIHESNDAFRTIYDPTHPDADENGMLTLPNVNVVEEMVNMVNASKAYEASATVANTTKTMIQAALGI